MKRYFNASHSTYYSLVASLPLLILYEIILTLTNDSSWQIRNAADVWLRRVLTSFDLTSQQASFFMLGIIFVAIPFFHHKAPPLKIKIFGFMLVESIIYSLFLGFVIHLILGAVFLGQPILASNTLNNLALSIGAGLFEEFVFRVLLLNVIFFGLLFITKKFVFRAIIAVLLASFLFSLSHYVGGLSDSFTLYTFLFRWIAGLLFSLLYVIRGFAITAYTHAFYDIWVLVF